jgi:hypothetical protein
LIEPQYYPVTYDEAEVQKINRKSARPAKC